MEDDLDRYERQAEDSRTLAGDATNPKIRDIHLEMARNYDLLAEDIRQSIKARDAGKAS